MTFDPTEISYLNLLMEMDKQQGMRVIIFHICSRGQVQFIAPIHQEMLRRKIPASCWLASDYPLYEQVEGLDIPLSRFMTTQVAEQMIHADIFLETEIYGRSPKNALSVFVGHGQPNKWTNWSEENLRAFDLYFLYGELERSMFEVIMQSRPESTGHIKLFNIGYPKLDDQLQGRFDRDKILQELGLAPKLKTIIYAPAWDPGGSLRSLGTAVAAKMLEVENVNVIAKLHPASLEPVYSPQFDFFTGGVDWLREFRKLETNPRFRYVNDYLVNPLLFASDVMVTDFSGVALEFMTLDRPVIYIDCPEFYEKTLVEWGNDPEVSKNDERFNAGRNTGILVKDITELPAQISRALKNPMELSEQRQRLSKRFLYNPGFGSKAAVDAILQVLDIRDVVLSKLKKYEMKSRDVGSESLAVENVTISDRQMAPAICPETTNARKVLPKTVQISISDVCNFKCTSCWIHGPNVAADDKNLEALLYRDSKPQFMNMDIYEGLIADLKKSPEPVFLSFCGKGEPTLHPQFLEMVRLASYNEFVSNITTNGSGLTIDVLKALREMQVTLNISLNAYNQESHQSFSNIKKDFFTSIIELIRFFRGVEFSGFISLSFVVGSHNIANIKKMVELSADVLPPGSLINFYPEWTHIGNSENKVSADQIRFLLNDLSEAISILVGSNINHNLNILPYVLYGISASSENNEPTRDYYMKNPCSTVDNFMVVLADGRVVPCCRSAYVYGNVKERSITDIWSGRESIEFRNKAKNIAAYKIEAPRSHCFSCDHIMGHEYFISRYRKEIDELMSVDSNRTGNRVRGTTDVSD